MEDGKRHVQEVLYFPHVMSPPYSHNDLVRLLRVLADFTLGSSPYCIVCHFHPCTSVCSKTHAGSGAGLTRKP